MNRIIIGMMAIITLIAGIEVKAQQTTESIMGSWLILTNKIDNKVDMPAATRKIAMFTDTHFVYGDIDPATMKIKKLSHGGSYTLKDGRITEHLEPFGKDASFTIRFEGGRLYKTGSLTTGVPCEQVWERFKSAAPKSSRSAADGSVSVGQQLIDLSKAKEAGAITEAEFQAQKAKLLGNK